MPFVLEELDRNIEIGKANSPEDTLAEDVYNGLTAEQKVLYPKYFYDEEGSKLFEEICDLPEYYQTRKEQLILDNKSEEIITFSNVTSLIEYGAGSARKTRSLLDAMKRESHLHNFVPIDVSAEFLLSNAQTLAKEYPNMDITGLTGDFLQPIELPYPEEPRLLAFLGSTIGNLTDEEANSFLELVTDQMNHNDIFLLGTDLEKDVSVLEAAYNDSQGITAQFNLNILKVINKQLGADFQIENFHHHAFYNREEAQIEMHLISEKRQIVNIDDLNLEVTFSEGESIRTEISCKYTKNRVTRLLRGVGLELIRWYTDPEEYFAISLSRLYPGMGNGHHV